MEKFQLSLLFKIIGISSASGLLYQNNLLYIVSDNSNYLYEYNMANEKLNKIALIEGAAENVPKSKKQDLESITSFKGRIIVLGSGSTNKRNSAFDYDIYSKKVHKRDFKAIYDLIKSQLDIKDDELNVEGFFISGNNTYFFQRGNGTNSKNGIIYGDLESSSPRFRFVAFDLPKIKNVPTTFTDAILVDETIYFLASAEDTTSTYLDGEVLGSLIGSIDMKTMKLIDSVQISATHKFEGLTLYKKSTTQIEFLLCEDNDTEVLESSIYKLVMDKAQ
ncbi:DUF6929 family protein [Flavobacterium sp.]